MAGAGTGTAVTSPGLGGRTGRRHRRKRAKEHRGGGRWKVEVRAWDGGPQLEMQVTGVRKVRRRRKTRTKWAGGRD